VEHYFNSLICEFWKISADTRHLVMGGFADKDHGYS
jgi:hypothetical protein